MNSILQKLPYTNVFVDPSLHAIHIECEGFVPSDIFRKTLLGVIDLIQANNLVACIYDIRKLKSLPPLDQDWFMDEVLPLLTKTSMRKVAVLELATSSGLLDLNQLVYTQRYSIPFELQYFEDVASALDWISRAPQTQYQAMAETRQNIASAV